MMILVLDPVCLCSAHTGLTAQSPNLTQLQLNPKHPRSQSYHTPQLVFPHLSFIYFRALLFAVFLIYIQTKWKTTAC